MRPSLSGGTILLLAAQLVVAIGCLIAGTAADEAAAAPLLQGAAPELRVWNADAPHIGALARFPDEREAQVIGFFAEALPS